MNQINIRKKLIIDVKKIYSVLETKYLQIFRDNFSKNSIPIESPNALVIVEPRKHPYLEFTIKNICYFVPGWKLYIFHSKHNKKYVEDILGSNAPNVHLIEICDTNLTLKQYSRILVSADFWNKIDADRILIFQTDSYILKRGIDKFLEYDYIGAPWSHLDTKLPRQVGNGGFSLRKKEMMLEIISKCPYKEEPEDIYFSKGCYQLSKKIPTFQVANEFSVEHVPHSSPFATHKWWGPYSTVGYDIRLLQLIL
jgi:hypothetical protein